MKKQALFVLAAAVLVLGGCKKKENREAEVPTVDVALPEVDSVVLHKTLPGKVYALDMADVVARVNGTLLTKNYTSGAYVKKGQVLFTIEPTEYQNLVKEAEAQLATAQSQYELYSNQYEARKKALLSDAVSQMDVLQAKASMEQAAASIASAKAALSQARLNLSYCTVTAPLSGYATSATVSPGEYVGGAGSAFKLCTIYDNSVLVASFDIADSEYVDLLTTTGGPDNILYRSIPLTFSETFPHKYSADLYYEAPSVNTNTGTLTLKGTVNNIDNELKDGMYVSVSLPYGVDSKAILIKDASIGTDQLGHYVYVVNDSNKVVYTPIKVGEVYRDSLRIVREGLSPTDRYITKALLSARDGMKVNPRMTGAKAKK